jgi:hypothetical protein
MVTLVVVVLGVESVLEGHAAQYTRFHLVAS